MSHKSFSHLSDEELMTRYQNGETEAFDVIYYRHKNRIYTYLTRRLADKNSVNEVYQNILLKFHKSRFNYNKQYPLIKWIYTISRSELLDFSKKKKMQFEEFFDQHESKSSNLEPHQIDLNDIKELSDKEKKVLILRYYDDRDFQEISRCLNLSESNVRKIVSRGIKKLKLKFAGGVSG